MRKGRVNTDNKCILISRILFGKIIVDKFVANTSSQMNSKINIPFKGAKREPMRFFVNLKLSMCSYYTKARSFFDPKVCVGNES